MLQMFCFKLTNKRFNRSSCRLYYVTTTLLDGELKKYLHSFSSLEALSLVCLIQHIPTVYKFYTEKDTNIIAGKMF